MLAPAPNKEKVQVESAAVFAQLERILASELFQHSKRYPNFLRYVVEHTLKGEGSQLKERTLGVAVFHRSPEYDTSADPVVRNTATEVRKRIEAYYGQSGREGELRIGLPVGSYVPEFGEAEGRTLEVANTVSVIAAVPLVGSTGRRNRTWIVLALFSAGCLGVAVTGAARMFREKPAVDRFWAPLLENKDPILVVMGPLRGVTPLRVGVDTGVPAITNQVDPKLYLLVTETHVKFASFLLSRGKKPEFALASETTASRLRKAPFILLGGFNNDWTMRATGSFRYYLQLDAVHLMRHIADRENPVGGGWNVAISPDIRDDYALVVRAMDPLTGQPMLAIAGMGEKGGAAAVEFITNPKYLESFGRTAAQGWEKRNIELVIQTSLVDGDWAAPRLVASYLW